MKRLERIAEAARGALCVAVFAATLGVGAAAQTALTPVTPDPQALALTDRIEALQSDLQKATAENERLQHELDASRAEAARLQKLVDAADPAKIQPGATDPSDPSPAPKAAPADAKSAYNSAYGLIAHGDYPGAEAAFGDFLAANPKHALAPSAHYWLGEALLAQNKGADAASEFLGVVKNSPKATKAPDAYLSLGTAFKQMGQAAQACQVFRDVPVKFPAASAAVKAKAAARAKTCKP